MHLMLSYYSLSVEGEISHETQLEQIDNSFKEVNSASDVVLVEGTGHCAVGSIVNANKVVWGKYALDCQWRIGICF